MSKCRCCQVAASETLVHLFIQSEVAVAVWKCFGELFNMLFRFRSILQAMAIWMAHLKAKSQYSVCRLGLVAYIFRELWVARSSATFEGKIMKAREVCLKVMYRVQLLKMVNIPKKSSSMAQGIVLNTLGISSLPVRKKNGRWVKWDKPSPGCFKVNIDGSERGGIITGGGIIRDHEGTIVVGFSKYYEQGSNNLAEFLALRDGLRLCKRLDMQRVIISRATRLWWLTRSEQKGYICRWYLTYVFRECMQL